MFKITPDFNSALMLCDASSPSDHHECIITIADTESEATSTIEVHDSDTDSIEILGCSHRWIVSIDVGFKNLGLLIYDVLRAEVVHWAVVDVQVRAFCAEEVTVSVQTFFATHVNPFVENSRLFTVLIEKQIPHPKVFRVSMIDCVLRGYLAGHGISTTTIQSKSVKNHFSRESEGLKTKTSYSAGKRRAVNLVRELLERKSVRVPDRLKAVFESAGKKDDMADAYLQFLFYIQTS